MGSPWRVCFHKEVTDSAYIFKGFLSLLCLEQTVSKLFTSLEAFEITQVR